MIIKHYIEIVEDLSYNFLKSHTFEGKIEDIYKMPLPKNIVQVRTYQRAFEQIVENGQTIDLESGKYNEKTYEVGHYVTLGEAKNVKALERILQEVESVKEYSDFVFYDNLKGFYIRANGNVNYDTNGKKVDGIIDLGKLDLDDDKYRKLTGENNEPDLNIVKKVLKNNGVNIEEDEEKF